LGLARFLKPRATLDHASAELTHEMPGEKTVARRNRARRFNILIDTHYEARSCWSPRPKGRPRSEDYIANRPRRWDTRPNYLDRHGADCQAG
jgi:hypothetical protein